MASSKNKNNRNSDVKESNNNFKIELFIKDLDNGDLAIFKTSINNINKDNSEKIDIPLEIYKNGLFCGRMPRWKKKEIWGYTIRLFNVEKEMKKVVKCLIEHGAGVNKANDSNETAFKIWDKTPLCIACEKRNEKIIKYLVEQGTDVNKGNNRAETPFHDACNNENEDLIKYLVEHGADINKENINNEIPLFIACERGIEKIIKYLVEHGADINKESKENETPLLAVCRNGNENIIKYLVEHGADIYKVIDILNCPIKRYVPRRRLIELKDNINDNKNIREN
ncbi:ankyrin repeat-containing domain protein [Neocallimastix lanati (nom. inval.)]|nr:ankyrin repeat-containing domain protein [Neocallimastix sp. JGI-2020a]